MNFNELRGLLKWCKALGLKKVGDIFRLKRRFEFKDNNHFINYLNACYVFGHII